MFGGASFGGNQREVSVNRRSSIMRYQCTSIVCLVSFACWQPIVAQDREQHGSIAWQSSFRAGEKDAAGKRMDGTEIIKLVSHEGALFGGNSYWGEQGLPFREQRGQVIRLDKAGGNWQLDFRLPFRYNRAESMASVRLEHGAEGKPIDGGPVSLLVVGGNYYRGEGTGESEASVFVRTSDGQWHQDALATYSGSRPQVSMRSITQYRDKVTGADLIFVGAFPYPPRKPAANERNDMGIFSGVYDPQQPSRVRWSKTAEFQQQGMEERVMGFAECNGRLYCSTSSKIYERTDGPNPTWQQLLDIRNETWGLPFPRAHLITEDMRALRAIRDAKGDGEVLLFAWLTRLVRFDPRTQRREVEADMLSVVSEQLGEQVSYLQMNENTDVPGGSALGIEFVTETEMKKSLPKGYRAEFGNAVYDTRGLFLVRRQEGDSVSFILHRITDPDPAKPEHFVRVRAICTSPFAGESTSVIYAAGFCPRMTVLNPFASVRDTAWIYRGNLK